VAGYEGLLLCPYHCPRPPECGRGLVPLLCEAGNFGRIAGVDCGSGSAHSLKALDFARGFRA